MIFASMLSGDSMDSIQCLYSGVESCGQALFIEDYCSDCLVLNSGSKEFAEIELGRKNHPQHKACHACEIRPPSL
jgi:hypothetical protein